MTEEIIIISKAIKGSYKELLGESIELSPSDLELLKKAVNFAYGEEDIIDMSEEKKGQKLLAKLEALK